MLVNEHMSFLYIFRNKICAISFCFVCLLAFCLCIEVVGSVYGYYNGATGENRNTLVSSDQSLEHSMRPILSK